MNAKIAGAKDITFSLARTDELDYKFMDKEINFTATLPPLLSNNIDNNRQKKEIDIFIENSLDILNGASVISIYVNKKTGHTRIDGTKNKPVRFKFTIQSKE